MQTTLAPAPSAVRTTHVPLPRTPRRAHPSWPLAVPPSRAHHSCPVAACVLAVGRDVPSRRIAPLPCAAWHRASSSCAFAVGRDVPIAPHRPVAVRGLASRAHSCFLAVHHRRALPERRDARAAVPLGSRRRACARGGSTPQNRKTGFCVFAPSMARFPYCCCSR